MTPERRKAHYHVPVNADVHQVAWATSGWSASRAAIANAVFHATGRRIRELPITPDKLL